MLKRHALFAAACAAACALPLAALLAPSLAGPFAPTPVSMRAWLRGEDLALAVVAVLAWRLNQNRLALAAAGLGIASTAAAFSAAAGVPAHAVADFWVLALPSGLGLSLLPRDGALFSGRTGAAAALMLLPAALAYAVGTSSPAEAALLLRWPFAAADRPSALATAAGLGVLIVCALKRLHPRVATAWVALGGALAGQTALAWGLGLASPAPALAARLWTASSVAATACLGAGLLALYWQRVYLDELTGVPNRRALDERLAHLDSAYSLAMVDIDHFKGFNDTYGHAQGDDVLRLVAAHLREQTAGRAYRYGGEEFCVLAQDLDAPALERLMDRVRASLAKRSFTVRGAAKGRGSRAARGAKVQVTVSVGVACRDRQRSAPESVMKLADEGLYEAKAAGRNRVVRKN